VSVENETVLDCILLLPVDKPYTYAIPKTLRGRIKRGSLVVCPVRKRFVHGIVSRIRERTSDDKDLAEVQSCRDLRLPEDLLELIEFVRNYYIAPLGVALKTCVPLAFLKGKPLRSTLLRFVNDPPIKTRSLYAQRLLEELKNAGEMELSLARKCVPNASHWIRRFLACGALKMVEQEYEPPKQALALAEKADIILTEEQNACLKPIVEALDGGYKAFLLHGVTGSGKTEVYLRAAKDVLRKGKGVIVLVPEIALTVQMRVRFEEAFGEFVGVFHSGLTERQRAHLFDQVAKGKIKVVVGARSALFAPVHSLGLIVVDEEHDQSYKQEQSLRYNARDLALVRGKFANCCVVLGSATPSLETFENVNAKKIVYLALKRRVNEKPLPRVHFVDLKYEEALGKERIFSKLLLETLTETLERGESAILFHNRRGFARFVLCKSCGARIECPNCSITLTVHKKPERLSCHYCDYASALVKNCPRCNSSDLTTVGFGTEKLEDDIKTLVPLARCLRLDSEVASSNKLEGLLEAFREGKYNVLIGTQIVAKGHDFPEVTMVGVLLAEQSLAFPDFRASEKTFQMLTQVAGRAGRGEKEGTVVIQTYDPDNRTLQFASQHDFMGFAVHEASLRKERRYPPFYHLCAIEVSSMDSDAASETAMKIKDLARFFAEGMGASSGDMIVVGPSVAAIERLKKRVRRHVLLKSRKRALLNAVLWKIYRKIGNGYRGVKVIYDVDPVSLL
jgi:primosomal protein N' (replication factor Y)